MKLESKYSILLCLCCALSNSYAFVPNHSCIPDVKKHVKPPISGRINIFESTSLVNTQLAMSPIQKPISSIARSLFRFQGQVPITQAFGLNFFLFALLRSKLMKMLTPEGFVHAFALGTSLWTTLGWRGWTLCVMYLILGSAVTKVRFAEKEKRGIAESRGGRRGPENVW